MSSSSITLETIRERIAQLASTALLYASGAINSKNGRASLSSEVAQVVATIRLGNFEDSLVYSELPEDLRKVSWLKQRIYQARKVLDFYSDPGDVMATWASGMIASDETLGKIFKEIQKAEGKIKTYQEKVIASLPRWKGNDLLALQEALTKAIDKRKVNVATSNSVRIRKRSSVGVTN